MTRVDFYVLPNVTPKGREILACRLAEKAAGLGHKVYIHLSSSSDVDILDDLLWTFRDRSFLPHAIAGRESGDPVAVLLGADGEPAGHDGLLINLSDQVPPFFSRFERVAEIVDSDENRRQDGRERFRFYKDRGYPLETHRL